jgi:hypothetical protein
MGRPKSSERAIANRGTRDRFAVAIDDALTRHSVRVGIDNIPEALADALQSAAALDRAMSARDVQKVIALAARLLSIWDFLAEEEEGADRDPRDKALLLPFGLTGFSQTKSKATVQEVNGEPILASTPTGKEPPRRPWAPSAFPPDFDAAARAAYPARPRHLGKIPPFLPRSVKEWRQLARRELPQLKEVRSPVTKVSTANRQVLDKALESAFARIQKLAIDATVAMSAQGATPAISAALRNFSVLSLEDVTRETGVAFSQGDGAPLLNGTKLILFHGASFTFLLDQSGKPTTLGLLPYPIVMPDPGSDMRRNLPPPGLYISVQRTGFSTFKVHGSHVSKVLFGGVGGFIEQTLHHRAEHALHRRLAFEILNKHNFLGAISVAGAFNPRELTKSRIEEAIPGIILRALPFTLAAVLRDVRNTDYTKLAKEVGAEALRELLIETLKEHVTAFLVKKIGTKIVPFLNLASAVYEWLGNEDERIRVRNAIACMLVAIRGSSEDEMTISSNVLGEVMADQFGEAVIDAVVGRGLALARRAPAAASASDQSSSHEGAAAKPESGTSAPAPPPPSPPPTPSTPDRAQASPEKIEPIPARADGTPDAKAGDIGSLGASPSKPTPPPDPAKPTSAPAGVGSTAPKAPTTETATTPDPATEGPRGPTAGAQSDRHVGDKAAEGGVAEDPSRQRAVGETPPASATQPAPSVDQAAAQRKAGVESGRATQSTTVTGEGQDRPGAAERSTDNRLDGPHPTRRVPPAPLPPDRVERVEELVDHAEYYEARLGKAERVDPRYPNLESEKTVAYSEETGIPVFSGPGRMGTETTDFVHIQSGGKDVTEKGHAEHGVKRYQELAGQAPRRHFQDSFGVQGSYYAHHAEVKDRIAQFDAKTNGATGVSKPMCHQCREWHRRVAERQKQAIEVVDPIYLRRFNPDGTVDVFYGPHFPNPDRIGTHAARIEKGVPASRDALADGSAW